MNSVVHLEGLNHGRPFLGLSSPTSHSGLFFGCNLAVSLRLNDFAFRGGSQIAHSRYVLPHQLRGGVGSRHDVWDRAHQVLRSSALDDIRGKA